jgi:hypothetical protein
VLAHARAVLDAAQLAELQSYLEERRDNLVRSQLPRRNAADNSEE